MRGRGAGVCGGRAELLLRAATGHREGRDLTQALRKPYACVHRCMYACMSIYIYIHTYLFCLFLFSLLTILLFVFICVWINRDKQYF